MMTLRNFIGRHYLITQKLSVAKPLSNNFEHLHIKYRWFSSGTFLQKFDAHFRLLRLHRPLPLILMSTPVLSSAIIACPYEIKYDELYKIGLLFMGCVTTRGAGCIINDIFDRNFDKYVERTKTRPLASGELSVREAFIPLSINSILSLVILSQFDKTTIGLGLLGSVMMIIYPLLKRFTYYPQLFLGLSFNFGVIMAWSAIKGGSLFVDNWISPISLYSFGILWTLVYDTIYAHQDKMYDKKLQLKSTALGWGDKTKNISGALAVQMAINLLITGYYSGLSPIYYVTTMSAMGYLISILKKVNLNNPPECQKFFEKNCLVGLALLIGTLLGKSYKLDIFNDP